ncbi:MAG: MarR family transcriptional regulator [Chitinophagales bacterium]|nr:MarR family transcriptional regulator [Chitinophagales bacterium]
MEIDKVIKQGKFKDNYQKAIVNLLYTSNYFRDIHQPIFKKYEIQGQHYNVLRILKGKYPDPVTPGYIKEVMLDKGTDLTRLIDKLKKKGWVERRICPHNKRQMDITITDLGVEQLTAMSKEMAIEDSQNIRMTPEEYATLSDLLDKMRG